MRTRFEHVNVIEALRKIMLHNTEYYHSDFEYDMERLQKAAKDSRESRCFLWLSRGSGTWCFEEREVYIRNTNAFNTWNYYSNSSESVKAFAVEIEGLQDKAVIGHVFELDYKAHIDEVQKSTFDAKDVEVVFKYPESSSGPTRRFDIDEYNNNWYSIGQQYGEIQSLRYGVDNELKLQDTLCKAKQVRILSTVAGKLDKYIDKMVKDRFNKYGYTHDDMVFTTPKDAFDALKYKVPVYMLSRDNAKEPAISTDEISYHIFHKGIFGMRQEDKQLLEYLLALPDTRAELFNQTELQKIYELAIAAGQSGDVDRSELNTIEKIIYKLDKALPIPLEVAENVQEIYLGLEV